MIDLREKIKKIHDKELFVTADMEDELISLFKQEFLKLVKECEPEKKEIEAIAKTDNIKRAGFNEGIDQYQQNLEERIK